MSKKIRIAVDAFGGDNAPSAVVVGALSAATERGDIEIILCGDEEKIKACAKENNLDISETEIINATDVITMHDDPSSILKEHKESSMAQALRCVAEGQADAMVTAGSTGAMVVGATFIVKRIKGVKRAAISAVMPTTNGKTYLLLDAGANAECRPEMLHSFAIMGSVYSEKVLGIKNPKVGLLNIGAEDTKGDQLRLDTYKLISVTKNINFTGNIEARDVPAGACDVVVADGFSGNIVIKLTEGVAMEFFGMIKKVFLSSLKTKIAALLVKKNLNGIKKVMDYSEHGGAPLLGVKKPVVKAHGSSDARAIKNAVIKAADFAASGAIDDITKTMEEFKNETV